MAKEWATRAWIVTGLVAAAVYFSIGSAGARALIYEGIGVGAALVVGLGARLNRPGSGRPWYLIAAGLSCAVVGDGYWYVGEIVRHRVVPTPSPADAFYVLSYVLLIAGMFMLTRDFGTGEGRNAFSDAAIVAIGAAATWFLFIVDRPGVTHGTGLATTLRLGYPAADVVMMLLLLHAVRSAGKRTVAFRYFLIAVGALLVSDAGYGIVGQAGSVDTSWLEAAWLVSYVFWGAASLHPSTTELLSDEELREHRPLSRPYLGLIAVAIAAGPASLVARLLVTGDLERADLYVVAGCSVATAVLVVTRLARTVPPIVFRHADEHTSDHRVHSLVDDVHAIVWEVGGSRGDYYVSRGVERILGYPAEDWADDPARWMSCIVPEDQARTREASREAIAAGRDHILDYRAVAADGRIVRIRDFVTVVATGDAPPRLCGLAVDVSDFAPEAEAAGARAHEPAAA